MPLGNGYLEDGLITLRLVFMSCDVRPASYMELAEGGVRLLRFGISGGELVGSVTVVFVSV